MKKVFAFTLAELLLTLGIIGVVAAMTIPTLNMNIHYNDYVTGCLKAYSTLSQVVDRMKPDYGPVGFGAKWNNADKFWDDFTAQLNTVQICKKTTGCFVDEKLKNLDRKTTDANYNAAAEYKVRTADGMSYSYAQDYISGKGLSADDAKNGMGRFVVDVNGDKGPNTIGLDVFCFVLVRGKGIVPAGEADDSQCTLSGNGHTCAAKILREKRIKYSKS